MASSIKPSFNANRAVLGERLPLDTPFSVILDSSERCNLKCSYCFRSGEKNENWGFAVSNEVMPLDVFELAVKQLEEFPRRIKLVSLSGHGEPLCNQNLAYMAQYLKKNNIAEQIDIHTNASLLTKKSAVHIAKAGFTRIIVSLQGLDAAAYERVCGVRIDFEQFYNNLKLMYNNKENDLKIHIKVENVALDAEDEKANERRFYDLFGGIADYVFVEKAVPLWRNISVETEFTSNKFGNDVSGVDYCPLLFYKIFVAPDGEIYPCTSLPPPMSLGNIRNITLREAWNSRDRIDFLKSHLRLTRHKHLPCTSCFVPVNSVTSSKDIIDPYREAILGRLEGLASDE